MSHHIKKLFSLADDPKESTLPQLVTQWQELSSFRAPISRKEAKSKIRWSDDHPRVPQKSMFATPGSTDGWVRPDELDESFKFTDWQQQFDLEPDHHTFAHYAPNFFDLQVLPHMKILNTPFSKLNDIIPHAVEKHKEQNSFSIYLIPWSEEHQSLTWAQVLLQTQTPVLSHEKHI